MFQITDLRRHSLYEAHVKMIFVSKVTTEEGETIPFNRAELQCSTEVLSNENDSVSHLYFFRL